MGQSASTGGGEAGDASAGAAASAAFSTLDDDAAVVAAESIMLGKRLGKQELQQLPDLAELSDHLLERIKNMDLVVARDSSPSSPVKAPPESPATVSSSVNRTEPTTRSSSPDPSEEGQEVVAQHPHHRRARGNDDAAAAAARRRRNEGAAEDPGSGAEDLSSIDTTGADVLVSTPPSSPGMPQPPLSPVVPALSARVITRRRRRSPSPADEKNQLSVLEKLSFLEEKKDEDATAGAAGGGEISSPGSPPPRSSRALVGSGAAESHDSSVTRKSDASSSAADEFFEDEEDDEPPFGGSSPAHHYGGGAVTAAATPSRGHSRRLSNDVISSADSGYFTATQSSDNQHRRSGGAGSFPHASPTLTHPSDTEEEEDDYGDARDEGGRRKLIVEGFPPQPRLEEDRAATPLEDGSASQQGRPDDPPESSSPERVPRVPTVRRRSDYDSVLASLHSSLTFESARIRLAPSAEEREGSASTAGSAARATASALSAHSALLQSLSASSPSGSPGHDRGDPEASRGAIPETSMSAGDAMGNVVESPSTDPLAVAETVRKNESLDSDPAVESTENSMAQADGAEDNADSEPPPEGDYKIEGEEEEETEATKTEPHWLLRSISGDERHDEAPAGADEDACDDSSCESTSESADRHNEFPDQDDGERTDCEDDEAPCSSTPASSRSRRSPVFPTQQTSMSDLPIRGTETSEEAAEEASEGAGGGVGPTGSPLVASLSPESEPDYVLLMSQASSSAHPQGESSSQSPSESGKFQSCDSMESEPEPSEVVESIIPPISTELQESPDNKMIHETDLVDGKSDAAQPAVPVDPSTKMDGRTLAGDATEAKSCTSQLPAHLEEDAIAAAAAVIRGNLVRADKSPVDPQKVVVKTIEGSPTLAERKASLYTPRKSGKRDPEAVLQLKERPLMSIESEDECDDEDNNDLSLLSPRQLDRSLTASRSRSLASSDSRSISSELVGSPPISPLPRDQILKADASHRQKLGAPAISLRDGLKQHDSELVPRVVGKESETLSTLSLTSLHTPSTSPSPTIFRTPLSFSKRKPSDPKGMSDLIRLDLWSRNPAVVESALKDLVGFASDSKNHGTMARTGGLLAVVRSMETHADQAGVQVQACRCLEKLALDHDNELAIGEVGGVESILGSMVAHGEDPDVQEAAWAALWNLTCGNADTQMVVDAAGGIEALVQCMVRHSENPEVQKNACGTLANLCVNNEERLTALAQAGGFVAISMALQAHWKHPDVRNEASYAMTILLGPRAEAYDVPVAHPPQQR